MSSKELFEKSAVYIYFKGGDMKGVLGDVEVTKGIFFFCFHEVNCGEKVFVRYSNLLRYDVSPTINNPE